jgi:hypothetical protein
MAKETIELKNPLSNFFLNQNTMKNLLSYVCVYHDKEDTLFIRPEPPPNATAFDWNGEMWIKLDPQTEVFLGIEIENFEKIFLKKHPELALAWKQFKPFCRRKAKFDQRMWESFIEILTSFLESLFTNKPQQIEIGLQPIYQH